MLVQIGDCVLDYCSSFLVPLQHPSSQFVVESEVSSDATEDMTTFFNQTSARLETLGRLEDSVAQHLLKMTLK